MFTAVRESKTLACICVEKEGDYAYIGSFAVAPEYQNAGVGKQVLALAEAFALNVLGVKVLRMVVVSQRPELIAYYERRGYKKTGEIGEYPEHLNVGIPKVGGLTVTYLEKPMYR